MAPKKETKAKATKKEEPKAPEMQLNYISQARTKTALNVNGINKAIDNEILKVETPLKEYKDAKKHLASGKINDTREVDATVNGEKVKVKETFERNITADEKKAFNASIKKHEKHVASYEADLAAYKKCRIRMGNHTNDAIASVADALMTEICERSMRHTFEVREKKNVNEKYLYESDLTKMTLFPLIQTLPLYVEFQEKFNAEKKADDDKKMIKDAIKAYLKENSLSTKKVVKKVEAEEVVEEEKEEVAEEKRVHPFAYTIKALGKDVSKVKFPDQTLRIHNSVYDHLSDLLEQLIARIVKHLVISIHDAKNKTITVDMVTSIIKRFLVDGFTPAETVTIVTGDVVDPKALEAEEVKKEAAKKAGKKYKIDESKLPTVPGRIASHSIEYPDTGYDQIQVRLTKLFESFAK